MKAAFKGQAANAANGALVWAAAPVAAVLGAQLLWARFALLPGADLNPSADALMGWLAATVMGLLWWAGMAGQGSLKQLGRAEALAMGGGLLVCAASAWLAGYYNARPQGLVLFMGGSLGLLAPFLGPRPKPAEATPEPPSLAGFAGACALAGGLLYAGQALFIRLTYDPIERGNTVWMFPRRALLSSEPIPGGAFTEPGLLLIPLGVLLGVLGAVYAFSRSRHATPLRLLGLMMAGALLLKLAVAALSPLGVDLLWLKARTIHSSYMYVALAAMERMSAFEFLRQFNHWPDILPVHAGTHGPLPELVHWGLLRAGGGSVPVATVLYMGLVNLAAYPVYRVTERLTGKSGLGLASAALWLASPQNLIMGNAGFDAALLGLLATSFWLYLRALDQQSLRLAAAAGLVFWLAQLASMASLVWPAAFLLFALARHARDGRGWRAGLPQWLGLWALWLALPLALHLLLWAVTAGDFNYLKTCAINYTRYAADAVVYHRNRPSYAWLWGNALVFAGYASLPLMLAWGLDLKRRFSRLDLAEGFSVPGAFLVLGMGLVVLGLAETHRDFIWATFFLLPGAARAMESPRPSAKGPWQGVQVPLLALAVSLAVLNAVLLEVWVLDQN